MTVFLFHKVLLYIDCRSKGSTDTSLSRLMSEVGNNSCSADDSEGKLSVKWMVIRSYYYRIFSVLYGREGSLVKEYYEESAWQIHEIT